MYWDIFALLAAAGKNLWFLWPMTFVFGLTSAIFIRIRRRRKAKKRVISARSGCCWASLPQGRR